MVFFDHYHVFTIHKDIFYTVAYMWHIFMIKYVFMDTYCQYTL